jgi:hypothetical protein
MLFMRRRRRERGFERFRGGGGHTCSYRSEADETHGNNKYVCPKMCDYRSARNSTNG